MLDDSKEGSFKAKVNGSFSFEMRLHFSESLDVGAEYISERGDYG